MLYAIFMYPEYGYNSNIEDAKRVGLKVGEKYEVEDLSMGQSSTSVYLKGIKGYFNSVQLSYEDKC